MEASSQNTVNLYPVALTTFNSHSAGTHSSSVFTGSGGRQTDLYALGSGVSLLCLA
jgi:hypothetical protein